jgi:predicted RNase H-like HicB family nuclease
VGKVESTSTHVAHELHRLKDVGNRRFTVWIQKDNEGGYVGRCLELPGAISEGETLEELKSNMTEAIQLILDEFDQMAKKDKKIIIEIPG